jgi:hypothetical protein
MPPTTTLEIHPAIGIARMGSSQEFFLGPEPGLLIETNRRDSTPDQLLKRQAARFRVYSCVRDEHGTLLTFEELTPDKVTITWTVHLVNRKAAAPRFLDDAGLPNTDPSLRRNDATGNDTLDRELIIDGGIQTLTATLGPKKTFQGKIKGNDVILGEMITDADGRLVVVGGFGKSASFSGTVITNFADNKGWYDDTSDGPVEATVHFLDGSPDKPVDKPAWVIACQPDFAPGIGNLVTLYDAFIDLAIYERNVLPIPTFKPAYDRDVFPLLNRATAYRWVNAYARDAHRPGSPTTDFASIPHLGDPTTASPDRKRIFRLLRDPNGAATPFGTPAMPALFSDDYFVPATMRNVLPLTRSQYRILGEWAKGLFDATDPAPAEGEPDALTRVVLEACAGGAFCPGIESGRRIRDKTIYMAGEVFRFDRANLQPGGLTQSLALPWQADFSACQWENPPAPLLPRQGRGWWPAQRPDDVLRNPDDANMVRWDRKAEDEASMVELWDQLGIVLETTDGAGKQAFSEVLRTLPE